MRLTLRKDLLACACAVVVLAFSAGSIQRARASVQSDIRTTLIANEQRLHRAVTGGDKAAFLALTSTDAVWVASGGFVPAQMFGDSLDQVKLTNANIENPQIVQVSADTSIVASVWTGSGTVAGEPFTEQLSSTVWTKRDSRWVAIYHQESNAGRRGQ